MGVCEVCGKEVTSVARDMIGTRNCGHPGGWPKKLQGGGVRNSLTAKEACDILNEYCKIDPVAMDALVKTRVEAKPELVRTDVQVVGQSDGTCSVGLLGIINGLFGHKDGIGAVTLVRYGEGKIRFVPTSELRDIDYEFDNQDG